MGLKVGTILKGKIDGEEFKVTSIVSFEDKAMISYVALIPKHEVLDESDWWADIDYIKDNFVW